MESLLLEKYIRKSIRKTLREQEERQRKTEKAMYLIYRFPGLKKVMEDLMSPSFARWISFVGVVAPKPTTLKVNLINGQDFTIIYDGRGIWSVKIAGKTYYIKNLPQLQRASKAISYLLSLNYEPELSEEDQTKKKDADLAADLNTGSSSSSSAAPDLGGDTTAPSTDDTPDDDTDDTPISDEELDAVDNEDVDIEV